MKPEELSESDRGAIREGIRRKYAEVAQAGPGCGFQYPTGKEGLTKLGYPQEIPSRQGPANSLEPVFYLVGLFFREFLHQHHVGQH